MLLCDYMHLLQICSCGQFQFTFLYLSFFTFYYTTFLWETYVLQRFDR